MNPPPDWPSCCAAVIPCFNEAGAIGGVVRSVRAFLPRAIVVDDGAAADEDADIGGAHRRQGHLRKTKAAETSRLRRLENASADQGSAMILARSW